MPKFPKTFFIKYENGGSGPDYPACYDDPMACCEMGEKITIGVYKLVETQVVEGVVDVSKKRKIA